MHKWTFWVLVLVISLIPFPVGAQADVATLSQVQVDVWPDLDRPAVLVLITATLPAETVNPATVRFALPVAPSAVAYVAAGGEMLNAPFETISEGEDRTVIEVEAPEQTVRVEYYFPYTRDGDNVTFTYEWLGGVAADQLILTFREPSQATEVTPDPRFEDADVFPDGQRYYQWEVGAVGADEMISADFAYVGPPPVIQSPATTGTTTAPAQEDRDSSSTLPVILAGAGGLLLGAGLGWALRNRRRTVRRVPQRAKAAKAAYCHQCGARLKSGDAFCRQCGTKRR
jgi:hypothetical protein